MSPRSVCGAEHPWLTDAAGFPMTCSRQRGHSDPLIGVHDPCRDPSEPHECVIALGATIAWTSQQKVV